MKNHKAINKSMCGHVIISTKLLNKEMFLLSDSLLLNSRHRVDACLKPQPSLKPVEFDWLCKLQGGAISHNMLQ